MPQDKWGANAIQASHQDGMSNVEAVCMHTVESIGNTATLGQQTVAG